MLNVEWNGLKNGIHLIFVLILYFIADFTMATPQDKFDSSKPLSVESMNRTAFARWTSEAQNEVIYFLSYAGLTWF